MEATTKIEATKTRKGNKAIVTVTMNGEVIATLGGARAERATAVVVTALPEDYAHYEGRKIVRGGYECGLRADAAAAATEAHRISTATTRRVQGSDYKITPMPSWSVAITE